MGDVLKLFKNQDKRYIKRRIDNFYNEFTKTPLDMDDLDVILHAVEEHLCTLEDSVYKEQCIYRIGEARFWLDQYENEDN